MAAVGDARKRLTENEPDAGMEALRNSLRWHFACHAEEPQKSYASLGIQNAETIVTRLIAAAERRALTQAADEMAARLDTFAANGRHTRARWAEQWLRDRSEADQ